MNLIKYILTTFIIVGISSQMAKAQQTVFNVPSADVTPKGSIFLQQESQFRGWEPNAFWAGTEYTALGIGKNTELTMTLFNVSAPKTGNIVLGTGFKSAIPIPKLKDKYPNREYKIIIGDEVLTSLQGNGMGNWSFVTLSGRLPKLNTRLTGGYSYGTKDIFGKDTGCFIGAIEQPVTKKFSIIADWYSGKEHFAGFLIPGISYSFPKNVNIYAGYQIPNSPENSPSGFVIELAKIF